MTDSNSERILEEARGMLADIAGIANGDPSSLSHSAFVMEIWKAFNKGRKYEKFVIMAEGKE